MVVLQRKKSIEKSVPNEKGPIKRFWDSQRKKTPRCSEPRLLPLAPPARCFSSGRAVLQNGKKSPPSTLTFCRSSTPPELLQSIKITESLCDEAAHEKHVTWFVPEVGDGERLNTQID